MVKYTWQRGSFLITLALIYSLSFSQGHEISTVTKLELVHLHNLPTNWRNGSHPTTPLHRLRHLFHIDTIRLDDISKKIRLKRDGANAIRRHVQENTNSSRSKDYNVTGEMAMFSGADYGTGQYFVQFKIGSPAQKFVLIVDTGSDLTWVNCKYRCSSSNGDRCRRNLKKRRLFRADHSSSFRTVPCSSGMCKNELASLFSVTRCPSPMDPCAYDYRYSDGSSALGLFANETITFSQTNGRKTRLHNVLVGCSESIRGQSFQGADGVMGLGYSNSSFAVKAATRFGGKFSYCLVDHLSPKNISSYLIFGSYKESSALSLNRMRYTELVLGVINPFYAVNIKGISIGDLMLEIPTEVWNVNGVGGTILDSGSSLTSLVQPAYQLVMTALKLSLLDFEKLNLDIGLEYCFNSTGFDESLVPRLVFHFADGARFEPYVKSYVIDVAKGVKCLGFVPAIWPGASVIGNIMQQNYFWEFDLVNSRLGFASTTCT